VAEATKLVQQAEQAPTTILQHTPLKTAVPKGKSVIFLDNGNVSTEEIASGVEQGAKAVGWSYSTVSYTSNNPGSLTAAFMTALQKKPAGVVEAGEDPRTFSKSVIDAYANAKIPIVAGSTCPVPSIGSVVAGSGTCSTNPPIGKALADWVVANANGKPVDVLMESMPQYNVYIGFREAFQQELTRLCPACKSTIQDTTLAAFVAGSIPSAFVNSLRANPSYNYLLFDNGAWAQGMGPALAAAGLQGKVTIIGNGINQDTLSGIKAGSQAVWSANSFEVYGYGNFDALLRAVTDSPGASDDSYVPFQLITADNDGDVKIPYTEPETALTQYEKLWQS
jgi:ribose transport system substrate-binding protein